MSGQPKVGLDYSPWSTDIFDNDTKIDELLDTQGWIGFSVYFFLCQKAYASDGYFYRWSYGNAATTARRMGGGIDSEKVVNVVNACLKIGLFDKTLFDSDGILTSCGIQKRFVEAISRRRSKKVDGRYWLLDSKKYDDVTIFYADGYSRDADNHSSNANDDVRDADTTKSKVKESKVNNKRNIKEKSAPTRDEVRAYAAERNSSVDPDKFFDYFDAGEWIDAQGKPVLNWKQKFITWEKLDIRQAPQRPQKPKNGKFFGGKPREISAYEKKALERLLGPDTGNGGG